ncbi:MAG: thioredoxin-disulfide reductase [Bifidobacteriaceae bacterium]|nr:thioredoxin-disulfide reductase [Bifidobacteriaceae bacterium]
MAKVIIIGSGPAGYTAAIYAARAGYEPVVIAGSVTAGGALINTTEVENFPGFPDGILGPELMERMAAQATKFGAQVEFDDATQVELAGPAKRVLTGLGQEFVAPVVIIATGSAAKGLDLEAEKRLGGRGVSYCATCDGFFFRGKQIMVVGGGDSAMEEAVFLTKFASKVTVVHRRGELRASRIMAERALGHPGIEFAWHSVISDIHGDTAVTGVTLTDTRTGETRQQATDAVFVAIGHTPRSELFKDQLELDPAGYIVVHGPPAPRAGSNYFTATSLPGVFACGDVVDHTYRQAITAAGSGARAAIDAHNYLTELEAEAALAVATV